MVFEPGRNQTLSFRGEVVEIFEKQGQRYAKITIESHDILDVPAGSIQEAHLGDHVIIDANVTIERVKPE